jgi:hypothetical protein
LEKSPEETDSSLYVSQDRIPAKFSRAFETLEFDSLFEPKRA